MATPIDMESATAAIGVRRNKLRKLTPGRGDGKCMLFLVRWVNYRYWMPDCHCVAIGRKFDHANPPPRWLDMHVNQGANNTSIAEKLADAGLRVSFTVKMMMPDLHNFGGNDLRWIDFSHDNQW